MVRQDSLGGSAASPLIISWPREMGDVAGGVRDQYHHAVDVVPTILDCADVDPPQTIRGHVQGPLHGVSMRYTFPAPDAPSARQTQLYRMPGARAIYHAGWKAVAADGPAGDGRWELFHVSADRGETHDAAARHPQKVAELAALWQAAADRPGSPVAYEGRDTPELLTGSWPAAPVPAPEPPTPRPRGFMIVVDRMRHVNIPEQGEFPVCRVPGFWYGRGRGGSEADGTAAGAAAAGAG
jgi:arylsulfatase